MQVHDTASPLAGKTVKVSTKGLKGPDFKPGDAKFVEVRVDDWFDLAVGMTFRQALVQHNWAALNYTLRFIERRPEIPMDDEVLYGHFDGFEYAFHIKDVIIDDEA